MMNLSNAIQVKNFLLVWRNAGFCLLNIPYTNPIKLDSDMLAGLLRAIQQVMSDGIKRITWKHQTILFEFADDLLYVLITNPISNEQLYRNELVNVRNRISKRFRRRPEWAKLIRRGQILSIRECALDVMQSFHLRDLDYNLTPILQEDYEDIPFAVREFNETLELLISFIDGKRTIYQIIDDSPLDRDMVLGLLSVLLSYEWIELVRVAKLDDRLKLIRKPTIFDLSDLGPLELLDEVLHEFRVTTTSKEVANRLRLNPHVVLFLAGKLLDRGVLTYMK